MSILDITLKPSDCLAPILELWECTVPVHSLYSQILSNPDRVLTMSQIELFNHLTVCKQLIDVKFCCIATLETI